MSLIIGLKTLLKLNFKYTYTNRFSFFIIDDEGEKIPVSNWSNYQNDFLAQFSILYELSDNGLASLTMNSCEVDTSEVLALSEFSKQILELPDEYPFDIYVQSDGQLNQNSFKFKYGFYDFAPNGNKFFEERIGAILKINGGDYLLPIKHFEICDALDEFNQLPESERTFQNNLKRFADIKGLSQTSALYLDSYLNNQEVHCPDKIKVEIAFKNGSLELLPTIEIENQTGFKNTFNKLPKIPNIYPISDGNGKTTRVVFDDKQKKELQKIKELGKVNDPEKIKDLIENPDVYFDEDVTDLSNFYSDRVLEIGIYKPKFYPFISPYKSEWIPGIIVKDKLHGEKRIFIKTAEELDKLINTVETSLKGGLDTINWEDQEIPIRVAEDIIAISKPQIKNPKKPIDVSKIKTELEVLIIKENAELTDFVQFTERLINIDHTFSKIDNLNANLKLKNHQTEGISWLQSLQKMNLSGCLLADDMGLGKTLQLLYFIEWHCQISSENKPYLIVAPVSLLENWENEYQKFFVPQNLSLFKLYGSTNLTKTFDSVQNKREALKLQKQQIILTNYETIRNYQATLCLVDFAVVALDEAQKIKTPGTLVTNACKALKADFKIAMTGTPVENTLIDIWCIIDFAVPGLLGNAKDFAKEFQNPLKEEETDIKELTEKLRNKIGLYIKRRLKKDVAKDLPKKYDNGDSRLKRVMPSAQLERYKNEIEIANSTEQSGIQGRNQKLKSIWALRDISDHPYLLDNQILNFTSEELIGSSAKLTTTIDLLQRIKHSNEKAIVFADRKETQKMLQKVIYDKFDIFPSIINGDTPSTKQREDSSKLSRQQSIDRYQSIDGFNIIIMSPLAAGVGLNVTEANHVIHYSRHWNPAKEEQSTDRAYRIGQLKEVFVYYPMAVFPDTMKSENGENLKSFDEILDKLLDNKKALASNTLFPTEQAEVKPDELYGDLFGRSMQNTSPPLSISQLDKLNPNLFEAAIAALYKSQGYDVQLTPYSNDKGVDVVITGENESFLIQVKQSLSPIGKEAIQEIYTARNYYESIYKNSFKMLVVANNDYTTTAKILAQTNSIRLIDRNEIQMINQRFPITMKDIYKIESQRLSHI
jgi:SNF2 family DNA or RNA helicase